MSAMPAVIPTRLFIRENTEMLFGDAKDQVEAILKAM